MIINLTKLKQEIYDLANQEGSPEWENFYNKCLENDYKEWYSFFRDMDTFDREAASDKMFGQLYALQEGFSSIQHVEIIVLLES